MARALPLRVRPGSGSAGRFASGAAGSVSGAMDLGISSTVIEGVPVLSLEGEADLASLPRLHDEVRRFVREHPGQPVVVDLDGLGHLDPVAVGVLVGARLQARAGGGDVELVCTSAAITAVFTGSGLDAAFVLHRSVADAAGTSAP